MATIITIAIPIALFLLLSFVALASKRGKGNRGHGIFVVAIFFFGFGLGIWFYVAFTGSIYDRFCELSKSCDLGHSALIFSKPRGAFLQTPSQTKLADGKLKIIWVTNSLLQKNELAYHSTTCQTTERRGEVYIDPSNNNCISGGVVAKTSLNDDGNYVHEVVIGAAENHVIADGEVALPSGKYRYQVKSVSAETGAVGHIEELQL